MEENAKVFSSDITRGQKPLQNNLNELINIIPAEPTVVRIAEDNDCDFQPKTDKLYVPKRRTKAPIKVRTVRDIRKLFETDMCPDLEKDFEKQQNYLLRKITSGSYREEKTKLVATNMLKSEKPISRAAWQMLMNLNPHGRNHAIQYVLWNGRCIRVNGSTGGKSKFLCNYDLEKNKQVPKIENRKVCHKRLGLLRSSLNIRLKPGPLSKKRILDDSYQKFNVGNIDLVNLPKPSLDIKPKYGIPLEPAITKFVHSLRDVNGAISEKWAEFSVSVLGTIKNKEAIQNNEDATISFELDYNYDQRRMVMRRDVDAWGVQGNCDPIILHSREICDAHVDSTVNTMLNEIVSSVEISLQQDNMYTGEDEQREQSVNVSTREVHNIPKEKLKRRFAELDRLDVTVIRLPEAPDDDILNACNNAHCSLGCVCSSLQRSFNLKQHCGRLECMFQCRCDFSKYKAIDSLENECPGLLPGLINLDNELNLNLAKEEQKFHQTVVMTGEKSIVLKSERRNWKATKRYTNFYNKMSLKSIKRRELLTVVDVKLNLENVEPWCMVHNMYKCFCKGIFTQNVNIQPVKDELDESKTTHDEKDAVKNDPDVKHKSRTRTEKKTDERNCHQRNDKAELISDTNDIVDLDKFLENDEYSTCARTRQYKGRKYHSSHYKSANKRISEMETNDDQLRKRMMTILNKKDSTDEQRNTSLTNSASVQKDYDSESLVVEQKDSSLESYDENSRSESLCGAIIDSSSSDCPCLSMSSSSSEKDNCTLDRSILNHTTNKTKLIAWLEASYKQYKKRVDQGVVKKALEPPKHGKVALYPWEFILTRYKERKNLFLISKEKPFRIFMAVDGNNSFFENCMNIDDIRFAELHKFPVTVKNLLTNATELKDNFCILCGLTHCWELIGSVTKVDSQADATDTEKSKNVVQFTMQNTTPNRPETQKSTDETEKETVHSKLKKEVSLVKNTQLRRSQRKRTKNRKFDKPSSEDKTESSKKEIHLGPSESSTDSKDSSDIQSVSSNDKPSSKPGNSDGELVTELYDANNKESDLSGTSKWFIMTVENDFSEIQFFKRGFFVKYDNIAKAINVARLSGQTVRLSSQKCGDVNAGPQFGIYAIPNALQYYVFVGPYEKDEPLGIETVRTFSDINNTKRTRGVWITTQKIDNIKVIDNPQAFMPPKDAQSSRFVPLEEAQLSEAPFIAQNQAESVNNAPNEQPRKDPIKIVKPITIKKTNEFYQLSSKSVLNKLSPKTYAPAKPGFGKSLLQPIILKSFEVNKRVQTTPTLVPMSSFMFNPCTSASPDNKSNAHETPVANSKPIAEIAPQIKIVDVYSESEAGPRAKPMISIGQERGMLVLKPEEINKRLMQKRINVEVPVKNDGDQDVPETVELDQDIENFLATSSIFVPPNADIFEISDDEEDSVSSKKNWKSIWIDCVNVKLGYLRGRKSVDNRISFEFPGFKLTEFYEEKEAFSKINQVLSRKIYVPKRFALQWRVVESSSELQALGKKELKADDLGSEFVLTKQGLRHKRLLMASLRKKIAQPAPSDAPVLKSMLTSEEIDKAIEIISDLDEQSKSLEDEGDVLFSEMMSARAHTTARLFDFKEDDHATLQTISESFQNSHEMESENT